MPRLNALFRFLKPDPAKVIALTLFSLLTAGGLIQSHTFVRDGAGGREASVLRRAQALPDLDNLGVDAGAAIHDHYAP